MWDHSDLSMQTGHEAGLLPDNHTICSVSGNSIVGWFFNIVRGCDGRHDRRVNVALGPIVLAKVRHNIDLVFNFARFSVGCKLEFNNMPRGRFRRDLKPERVVVAIDISDLKRLFPANKNFL